MKKHPRQEERKPEEKQTARTEERAEENAAGNSEATPLHPSEEVNGISEKECDEAEAKAAEAAVQLLQKELETERQARSEAEDRHLRLAAEYDNFRKRSRREKDQIYSNAKQDVVKSLLPIMDSLDRAIDTLPLSCTSEETKAVLEGLELVRRQALDCLAGIGVEEMKAEGEQFDPELHEAIQHIEDENAAENCIVKAVLKGYKLGDNVIRHAAVIVAN